MAERWAVANGNWSNTATWDGGTLPDSLDDVFANGYTVTINQDATVLSVNTTAGSSTTGARQFTSSNSEYFNCGDNTVFEVADNDAWWAGWVYLTSKTTSRCVLSKWSTPSLQREFSLAYDSSLDRFTFTISSDGTNATFAVATANLVGSPSLDKWYFLIAYHDATNNEIGISVNASAFETVAAASGIFVGSSAMRIGAIDTGSPTALMDGRLARLAMGKSPSGGIAALATTIRDSLFNNWNGKLYSDLTPSEKTDWGLVWYADGTESSGNLIDQHGGVNGTDTNTVTAARGPNIPQAGGGFTLGDTYTLTANVNPGSTDCVTFSTASPGEAWIVGNVIGSSTSATISGVRNSNTGTINITGNVTGSATQGTAYGCINVTTGIININGNVTGGTLTNGNAYGAYNSIGTINIYGDVLGNRAVGAYNNSTGTINITGNVNGSTNNSNGYGARNQSSGTISVTGNVQGGASAYGIINVSSGTIFIGGNVTGGSGSSFYGIYNQSNGTINVTGDVQGGTASNTYGVYQAANAGNITITGNVTSGSTTNSFGVRHDGSQTVNITGNVTGGSTNAVYHFQSGTVNITGNVTGGNSNSAHAVYLNSNGILNVVGDVTGGTSANARGIHNQAGGTINITGNVIASTASSGVANSASTGKVSVSGDITAAASMPAITNSSSGTISVSGNMTSSSTGYLPFLTSRYLLDDADHQEITLRTDAGSFTAGSERTLAAWWPTGGATCSGEAAVEVVANKTISGGLLCSGSAYASGEIRKTIGTAPGRDYSTITFWAADLDNPLVYVEEDHPIGVCFDDSTFDESVTISGGTYLTLPSVTLTADESCRHNGLANTGVKIVYTGTQPRVLQSNINNLTIEWLEIDCSQMASVGYKTAIDTHNNPAHTLTIQNNIIHDIFQSTDFDVHGINNFGVNLEIKNNIIYDLEATNPSATQHAMGISGNIFAGVYTKVHNTTIYKILNNGGGEAHGIDDFSYAGNECVNSIVMGAGGSSPGNTSDFEGTITGIAYCMSSDATASGTGSLTSRSAADQFVSIVDGAEDFRLRSTADAIDAGTDLSIYGSQIDITGYNRQEGNAVWDMGAHERVLQQRSWRKLTPSGPYEFYSTYVVGTVYSGSDIHTHNLFYRFENITIPRVAKILNATITNKSLGNFTGLTQVDIRAIAHDNAPVPTYVADVDVELGATLTENSVSWSIPELTTDEIVESPNFNLVVQEITSRQYWVSGNAIVIEFINYSSNSHREFLGPVAGVTDYPILTLEYEVPSLYVEHTETPDGGIVTSGTYTDEWIHVGSGGILAGGEAVAAITEDVSGGITLGGSAYVDITFITSGGTVLGGEAVYDSNTTEILTGGVVAGTHATISLDQIIEGGMFAGGTANIEVIDKPYGGISASGRAEVGMVLKTSKTFTWNIGSGVLRWYRVEGICRSKECPAFESIDECQAEYNSFLNVQARNVTEVLEKLIDRNWTWPIKSIKRFSLPALLSETPAGTDLSCNVLEDITETIPINQFPELFAYEIVDVQGTLDVESPENFFSEFASSGTPITLGGSATVVIAGEPDIVIGGSAAIESTHWDLSGSGLITLSGAATLSATHFAFRGSGSIRLGSNTTIGTIYEHQASGSIRMGGEAFISMPGLEDLIVEIGVDAGFDSEYATYATTYGEALDSITTGVLTPCCAVELPRIIYLSHNIGDANNLSQFLKRNNLSLPSAFDLIYDDTAQLWYGNEYLRGFAYDLPHEQTWNITLEFGCVSNIGGTNLGSGVWMFGMYIKNTNLTTGRDFDTRFITYFSASSICEASINFTFNINTTNKVVTPSPIFNSYFNDDAKLFQSKTWIKQPLLKFGLSSQIEVPNSQSIIYPELTLPLYNVRGPAPIA